MKQERLRCLATLKHFVTKIKKAKTFVQLVTVRKNWTCDNGNEEEPLVTAGLKKVPRGYFAVSTVEGTEEEQFVVELRQLRNPAFLRLLEKSREEYGGGGSFRQEGVLALLCPAHELKQILEDETY